MVPQLLIGHANSFDVGCAAWYLTSMAHHYATIRWALSAGEDFIKGRYSRGHSWEFDGGIVVPGSSSPHVVALPRSVEAAVDPEEAFVAALSSCHMLSFLYIAAKRKWVVASYEDAAVGTLAKNDAGRLAITEVVLRPRIRFQGPAPSAEELNTMHDLAHHECFIANSVKTDVRVASAD